ncbi:HAD-IC family P-type ATPase [Streptomyces sp. L7]|uniref:HAD-IC family P-type ATPase n=1 Tax=Streptomyces sp. L7 TaxID=3423954 RepID=UPI003D96A3B4
MEVVDDEVVIGRVTPDRKRDIVAAFQSAGRTVAVTGDGANDIPALKRADIGIAMSSGTDATKAIARMVLLDGRFAELPAAVAEGRRVMANIERISRLFLTKTVYASVLAFVCGVFLLAFPFLPRQLSVVDGLTIGLPAFFLALLPNLRRYEHGFLRRSLRFAVPSGCAIGLLIFAYTWIATTAGVDQEALRTGATLILAIVALWVLVVVSRPFDPRKLIVFAAMVGGLVVVFTLPMLRRFLVFVALSPAEWAVVVASSIAGVALVEIVAATFARERGTGKR